MVWVVAVTLRVKLATVGVVELETMVVVYMDLNVDNNLYNCYNQNLSDFRMSH